MTSLPFDDDLKGLWVESITPFTTKVNTRSESISPPRHDGYKTEENFSY